MMSYKDETRSCPQGIRPILRKIKYKQTVSSVQECDKRLKKDLNKILSEFRGIVVFVFLVHRQVVFALSLKGRVGWWWAEMEKADSRASKSSQTGSLPSSHLGSKRQTEKSSLGPRAFREREDLV